MDYEEAIDKYEKLIYYVMGKYKIQGFELEDMFNIGRYSLWVCCKTFDETKGYAFSTYLVKALQNECYKMYIHSQRAKRSKDSEVKSMHEACCNGSLTYEEVIEAKDLGNIDLCKYELYQLTDRLPHQDKEIVIQFLDKKFINQDYTIKEFCLEYKVSYIKMRRILDDYRYVISVEWGY